MMRDSPKGRFKPGHSMLWGKEFQVYRCFMTSLDIANQRLHNQRLVGAPFKKPEDVVQWLGAVQSQEFASAKWAIAHPDLSVSICLAVS